MSNIDALKGSVIMVNHGDFGKFGVNISDLISLLIKEAGKCDHYASDVIYGINSLKRELETRHAMEV